MGVLVGGTGVGVRVGVSVGGTEVGVWVGVSVGGTGIGVYVGVSVGGTAVDVWVGAAVGGTGVAVEVGTGVGAGLQAAATRPTIANAATVIRRFPLIWLPPSGLAIRLTQFRLFSGINRGAAGTTIRAPDSQLSPSLNDQPATRCSASALL
jgi:hypothetical protein